MSAGCASGLGEMRRARAPDLATGSSSTGTRRHAPTARCGVFSGVLSGVTNSATLSARDPRDDALSNSWIL